MLVAGSFIVALIILHLITMRIADFVVDSRIGPLDRTLGFVFGMARGVLIAVVGVVFFVWLIGDKLPTWATESKSLPILQKLGDDLIAVLPPDMEKQVTDLLHKRQRRGRGSRRHHAGRDGAARRQHRCARGLGAAGSRDAETRHQHLMTLC